MKLKQFSIRGLLIAITLIATGIWYFDTGYQTVYSEQTPEHGKVTVSIRPLKDTTYQVRVKLSAAGYPASIGEFLIELPEHQKLEIESQVHPVSGLWCIYDTVDVDVVILVKPTLDWGTAPTAYSQWWHPGIHIGWGRGVWANWYFEARLQLTTLPYGRLPVELPVATAD